MLSLVQGLNMSSRIKDFSISPTCHPWYKSDVSLHDSKRATADLMITQCKGTWVVRELSRCVSDLLNFFFIQEKIFPNSFLADSFLNLISHVGQLPTSHYKKGRTTIDIFWDGCPCRAIFKEWGGRDLAIGELTKRLCSAPSCRFSPLKIFAIILST